MTTTSVVAPREFSETGRGLGATVDVARGEVLLSVPFRSCFSKMMASMAPELRPFATTMIGLREQDLVILHLLVERSKGEASPRAGHVAAIPATYDMPLFWSAEELAELEVLLTFDKFDSVCIWLYSIIGTLRAPRAPFKCVKC